MGRACEQSCLGGGGEDNIRTALATFVEACREDSYVDPAGLPDIAIDRSYSREPAALRGDIEAPLRDTRRKDRHAALHYRTGTRGLDEASPEIGRASCRERVCQYV